MKLPALAVASNDSQLVCPSHGHVSVAHHHDCIHTLGQGELGGHRGTWSVVWHQRHSEKL